MMLFFLFLFYILNTCNSTLTCSDANECQSQPISDTTVYCQSSQSCSGIASIDATGALLCQGTSSCGSVSSITTRGHR